jgi:hypothetical protein
MDPIKIGIIGSCVSRDNFNSKFISNYKDYYSCVFHQNQMSMISLAAKPIPFEESLIDNIEKTFDRRHFITELDKSIWDTLILNKPDYLILDFYGDIYFGAREIEDSYITNKRWLFSKTTLYHLLEEGNAITLTNDAINFVRMWMNGVESLFDFLEKHLPDCKVIINKARFVDEYIDKATNEVKLISESGKQKPIPIDLYNYWWEILDSFIIEKYNLYNIDYRDKVYLADEDHPWGLFYPHYVNEFYEDFTKKLLSIIINDLKQKCVGQDRYIKSQKGEKVLTTNETIGRNLIKNSTFNLDNCSWSKWHNDFSILNPESDKPSSNILGISKSGLTEDIYRQVWSNAVEINADGIKEFTLSFDIKVNKMKEIDSYQIIFCIRMFNDFDKYAQSDSLWYKNIKLSKIKELKDDEWIRYTYTFIPFTGKYIKIAPYLFRNGTVFWREIKLEEGHESTNWTPCVGAY